MAENKEVIQEEEVKEPETKEEPKEDPKTDKPVEVKVEEPEVKVEDPEIKEQLETALKSVSDLEAELSKAQDQIAEYDELHKELTETKTAIEKAEGTIKEYEDLLNKMIDNKMKMVPEDFKDLIPSNLNITQKLEWLNKAEEKNLFNKKNAPEIEVGKPMGSGVQDNQIDVDSLSNSGLLSLAYNRVFKK